MSLDLLAGAPYVINEHITVSNPTLETIRNFGEKEYWDVATRLTATAYDFKLMLEDSGIRYEEVGDYDLFIMLHETFTAEESALFFNIDLSSMKVAINEEIDEVVLLGDNGTVIDRAIHTKIVTYLRDLHGFERNWKVAGNEYTRKFYMDEDRRNQQMAKRKKWKSVLTPLVSTLVNCTGFKYDYSSVWNMSIYAFMDAVKRIQIIRNTDNIMTGIYTGNIDAKKMNKKELNIFRES